MAKKNWEIEEKSEMTLEEARAYRAARFKPTIKPLSDQEKREKFRMFWATSRKKYGKSKELEQILWIHLKAIGCDVPEKFEEGINHFGFKKIK